MAEANGISSDSPQAEQDAQENVKRCLQERYPHVSSSEIAKRAYQYRNSNINIQANRQASYALLTAFDAFCADNDIEYFMFANTLVGAVVYQDFVPGSSRLEIGMLRDEYDKLVRLRGDDAMDPEACEDFYLDRFADPDCKVLSFQPLIKYVDPPDIRDEQGRLLYDKDHLPRLTKAQIELSIFDKVPDDYGHMKLFFWRIRRGVKRSEARKGKKQGPLRRARRNRMFKLAAKFNGEDEQRVSCLVPKRSKSIALDELLPLKRLPLGPVMALAPHDTTTWIVEDAEKERAQVRILQNDALEIIKEIDRVCRANDIGYFICGGTMLGYVRHGGFIPWDDDMDIGMLRPDYEKFARVAPTQLDTERFFFQTRESDPNIPYIFSKVRMNSSEYITAYNKLRDFHKGICVDIFPFDRIPDDREEFLAFKAEVLQKSKAHNKVANRQIPEGTPRQKARSLEGLAAHAALGLLRKYYWGQSLAETQRAYTDVVTRYDEDESLRFVASFIPTFTMVSLDDLLPYRDVDFEGVTVKLPAHPEVFLQMQYGDFMTEPLPHQQRGHGLLWWSDPEFNTLRDGEDGNEEIVEENEDADDEA